MHNKMIISIIAVFIGCIILACSKTLPSGGEVVFDQASPGVTIYLDGTAIAVLYATTFETAVVEAEDWKKEFLEDGKTAEAQVMCEYRDLILKWKERSHESPKGSIKGG